MVKIEVNIPTSVGVGIDGIVEVIIVIELMELLFSSLVAAALIVDVELDVSGSKGAGGLGRGPGAVVEETAGINTLAERVVVILVEMVGEELLLEVLLAIG